MKNKQNDVIILILTVLAEPLKMLFFITGSVMLVPTLSILLARIINPTYLEQGKASSELIIMLVVSLLLLFLGVLINRLAKD